MERHAVGDRARPAPRRARQARDRASPPRATAPSTRASSSTSSSGYASSSPNDPTRRRRSDARCAQPPSAVPRSAASDAHVRAAAALDQRGGSRVRAGLELLDVEAVDAHVARCPFDFLAFARELVQAATTDLHRRHHRRQLLDLAEEAARAPFDLVAREHHRLLVEHCARRVERGGGDAEHDTAPVRLGRLLEEAQQARRATEPDEQHAGGVGVERARVPDASLPVRAPHPGDDVVTRPARGLVDDDQAVMHRDALRGMPRCARPTRGSAAARRTPRRTGDRRHRARPRSCRRRRRRASAGSRAPCRRPLPSART